MTVLAQEYELRIFDGAATRQMIETLADVYIDIYRESPYASHPVWSRPTFMERTLKQTDTPGFKLVAPYKGDKLLGMSFGFPMEAGRWFRDTTPPPETYVMTSKFAVIELGLIRTYRGRGIGRKLIDTLLGNRSEPYAILCSIPGSSERKMYDHWGWQKVSESLPNSELPPLHVLVLSLDANANTNANSSAPEPR